MANLSVTIYHAMGRDVGNASVPAPQVPSVAEWSIDFGLQSKQSDSFPINSKFISVTPSDNCCLAFGKDPIAKPKFHPVGAGETRWYGVTEGHRLAVIEAS